MQAGYGDEAVMVAMMVGVGGGVCRNFPSFKGSYF